ncbi:MAG TPA: adenylate/guanylate cyclase domain-containing protein [Mycobacteriales bacterium]|nr:adenylate/guanylate cyclase domain-containing protein [Mycobacteriales bacterium]
MTFAFVDVVGSTRTFAEHGDAFVAALAALQERVARHTSAAGGAVVKTEGDGAFLAFASARSALDALVSLQEDLERDVLGTVPRLVVRAGAHTGDAVPVADDYVALAVNVAARVTSAAEAGQVVATAATQAELAAPAGVCVGEYDLKDVADPVQLWRVYGDETPLRASPARRTNVRVPVMGFVGRDGELAELRDLVAVGQVVTVLGPGGLGKTRMVSELLLQIAAGVDGGAWLVELASLTSGDQIPAAIGEVLGVREGELGGVAAELRRRGEVVLVLDNCEHLIEAVADVVAELHQSCPGLRVVCTSREPLQIAGEEVWRLGSLNGEARVELFTQRARASGATVPEGSAEVVGRLCAALDGLPLAIELAATHSGSTSLEELIEIAEHGTDVLSRRGGQRRQRSLDALLAWSLDYLPARRRASLLALSLLPGRFDLQMATTILGAVPGCESNAVRPLARASLIDLDGESYRMLDTIRHAARRQLADDPALAGAARLGLRSWAQRVAADLERMRLDHAEVSADVRLALEAALEQAMDDKATGIGHIWEVVRLLKATQDSSVRIVELAQRVILGPLPVDTDGDLAFNAAVHLLAVNGSALAAPPRLPVPDSKLEAIAAAADSHGMSYASGYLHYNLAFHYASRDEVASARRHADAFVAYTDSPAAQPRERAEAHTLRAVIAAAAGASDEALLHHERALVEAKAVGIELDLACAHANMAEALLDVARPAEALPHAIQALRGTAAGPFRRNALFHLARAQSQLRETAAALATVREIEVDLLASSRSPEQVQAELDQLRTYVGVPTAGQT